MVKMRRRPRFRREHCWGTRCHTVLIISYFILQFLTLAEMSYFYTSLLLCIVNIPFNKECRILMKNNSYLLKEYTTQKLLKEFPSKRRPSGLRGRKGRGKRQGEVKEGRRGKGKRTGGKEGWEGK